MSTLVANRPIQKSTSARDRIIPTNIPIPRETWYVAAFSDEVSEKPFTRRIAGIDMVFFRDEAGQVVVLEDRCPHRAMPLSMGKVCGSRIECGYHGFMFDRDGNCTDIPSQQTIPRAMAVRSFPAAERWQWIWVWTGERDNADASLIPDHHSLGLDRDGYGNIKFFVLEINGHLQLLHENLLDLTHITYLHPGLLDAGNAAAAGFRTEYEGNVIRLIREMPAGVAGKAFAHLFAIDEDTIITRELITEAHLPNLSVVRNIIRPADRPNEILREFISPFAITPRDDENTYQFVAGSSSFSEFFDTEERVREHVEGVKMIFEQDRLAIEAIQREYDRLGDQVQEVSVRADEAALRSRRVMCGMA
ncbi:oxidoreductase subunit alpha [Sphingobium jiangsuense]|uniref:Vanillate O-demethylase monooxygenase subunit n=1 Tax=Sphingobium jiangsuense TaxID=870476 RepID=A0A7W6BQJ5_9SPHN|nr:aromatic ring-hydroxylating dioxygenase subunit alpha [Sphingobium jiangsuense]MBB3926034.1 vanillate O-demethylase monooxygenase subunit [Sphingobium jiangsuense]GLT00578.1 oxidoreductase subunit alpha [Sphingobium jiangsuense]